MKDIFTEIYNIPIVALSNFNNTVVMGSVVTALILTIPLYPLTKKFVVYYREKIDPKFEKFKIVQMVKGSKLYGLYEKTMGSGV